MYCDNSRGRFPRSNWLSTHVMASSSRWPEMWPRLPVKERFTPVVQDQPVGMRRDPIHETLVVGQRDTPGRVRQFTLGRGADWVLQILHIGRVEHGHVGQSGDGFPAA